MAALLCFTLLYSTLLYSTLLYSTLLYSTLLYSTLLYSTLLYSTLLYSTLLYFTLLYSTLLYSTLLYSTLLYSTLLYSTLLYSTLLYFSLLYFTTSFQTGQCIIHTVRKGHFVRILHSSPSPQVQFPKLRNLALSKFGDIIFSTWEQNELSRVYKYSVNGKMLKCIHLKDEVTALIVRDDYVLMGTAAGTLSIKGLHR